MDDYSKKPAENDLPTVWEHVPRTEADRTRELVQDAGFGPQPGDQQTDGESAYGWPRLKWPVILFLATCLSTFVRGGPSYAAGILTILLCHEFGHFIQARRYKVPASLPYFIPMPISPLGTMGAVIGMSGGIPNRKALFDIGISGPLAGLGPALLATWFGLQWSKPVLNPVIRPGTTCFNEPLIFDWFARIIHGPLPDSAIIQAHPLAMAGWAGLFVTALNLIPIGQLDGGHILYAMLRRMSYPITTLLLYGALAAMVLTNNYGWSLMVILLLLSGPTHPPTRHDAEPLGWGRTVLGWVTLSFIFVGFTPVPITFAS